LALPVVGGLESLAGAVVGGAFLATAQPLVNLFHIRLFLATSVALILVALSGHDGATGMTRQLWNAVADALGLRTRIRYGSFVPDEPVVTNGKAHARIRLHGEAPPGSLVRLRIRGAAQ
jgi:hypothetical protein